MELSEMLKELPKKPGVYRMLDSLGNIIYVGKAKNLKNRVSQYFRKQKDRPPKVEEMIQNIHTFYYSVTDTELDAFVEECRLIKEIKPRYNRLMKNDKKYIYIKIPAEPFPKAMIVREKLEDGALYFGPLTSLHRVESTVEYLSDFYPIRKCTTAGLVKRAHGCLFRQLGTCLGPCTGEIASEEYWNRIENIKQLLNGNDTTALQELSKRMDLAVENLKFEKAAEYREYYLGIQHVIRKQRLVLSSSKNKNILVVEFIDDEYAKVFLIKGNKLLFGKVFPITTAGDIEFMEEMKEIIRDTFTVDKKGVFRLTQQDIDEAQIIYSYLKRNKKSILSFWIPSSRLNKDSQALEDTVRKIVHQIQSQ